MAHGPSTSRNTPGRGILRERGRTVREIAAPALASTATLCRDSRNIRPHGGAGWPLGHGDEGEVKDDGFMNPEHVPRRRCVEWSLPAGTHNAISPDFRGKST